MLLIGISALVGVVYMVLFVPMFLYDDNFEIASLIGILILAFLVSTLVVAPFEYRLDRKFSRTSLHFRGYLGRRLRSTVVFLIPFFVFLIIFDVVWLFAPSLDESSPTFIFVVGILAVAAMWLVAPRLHRSTLKKQNVANPEILESIRGLMTKMGISGTVGGVYEVPAQGFKVANAAQLGLARKQRRIYLIGDIERILTKDEVEAVIAHEFAHMKLRHIMKLTLIIVMLMIASYGLFGFLGLLLLYVVSFGIIELTIGTTFILFVLLSYVAPFILVYLLLFTIRRTYELEADQLAAKSTSPRSLSGALVKLGEYNLVPMKFPRLIGAFMPHPSTTFRLERLKRMEEAG
jgi:Zn-dependent protease with chaperone function